ncbi:DUF3971 domain-containing protein [Methylocystis heyeri]|nr:DUF3971 domain-containing protein [Methylocystis heyeri]
MRRPRLSAGARRFVRGAGGIGIGILLILSMAAGVFLTALSRGPIGFDWLAPTIVRSLDELYAGRYAFGLKGVAVANTDHGPTLTIQGLTVKCQDRLIVAAPRAEISVDLSSLLSGRIKPHRLEMLDLELRLSVLPDGRVTISAGAPPQELPAHAPQVPAPGDDAAKPDPDIPVEGSKLLGRAGAALRILSDLSTNPDSAIGAIDRVGISHGRLVIDDRTVDRVISYDDLALSLDKSPGGMKFTLGANAGGRRWSISASAHGLPGSRRDFDAQAQSFTLDDIALLGGLRKLPFDTDSRFSAKLHYVLGAGGRVLEAGGALRLGKGFFRLEEPDFEPVMITELSGAAHWDAANRQFVVSPVIVKTAVLDLAIEGAVAPPPPDIGAGQENPASDLWKASFRLAKPTVLAPERPGQQPLHIDRSEMRLQLSLARQKFELTRFELGSPEANVTGSAVIDWVSSPHVAYGINLENTQIGALTRLAPTHAAAPVRYWLTEHAPAGIIRRGEFKADFTQSDMVAMRYENPPTDAAIHGEAEVVNVSLVDLIPGLPPVTVLAAHLHQTGRTFSLDGASGYLDTHHEHRINLSEGRLAIADNSVKPSPSTLDLRLAGGVEAAAEIVSIPSLAPLVRLPLEPSQLKGQIEGRLHADLEIGDNARADRTVVAVEANAFNLSIERFFGAERLEGAALNIVDDPASGLKVTGGGRLYGGSATIDLKRAPGEGAPTQAQLSLVLDDAARAKAGFALPGVSGPVVALVKTNLPFNEAETPVELDLSRASLDNILPGVAKPAGKPAKAQFTFSKRPEGVTLERFTFETGPTQIAGVVDLSKEGAFRSAKFSQFRLSPGDEARVEVQRAGEGLKLSVRGTNLDARAVLRGLTSTVSEKPSQGGGKAAAISFDDLDLDLKSPIVSGFGKQILSNVDLKWERKGGRVRQFALSGNFGREPLSVALSRGDAATPQIEISTADGGALLSFLDLYGRMDSGMLGARIQLGQGRSDGVVTIRDFYLKNEPAMRQLMSQGASRVDDKGGFRFDPESVRVQRLQAGFMWSGGRLSLRDGIMSGPEMGLSFDGYIDMSRETVDIGGSYVPVYGLNNLVSNIPVFGQILTGGAHEGIFALNYRVTGALGSPTVRVNPLSALTPGLFRKIMGVMDNTASPPEPGR